MRNGRLTIDGASAADKGGVTLHGHGMYLLGLTCRDVIVRHLRVRRSRRGDGIGIGEGAHRVLIDHCSVSWADDENFGINCGHYVTVQWCIISEGLIEGEHPKGAHSKGMLVAHGANHVSLHHNFWSGNVDRNALLYDVGGGGKGGEMPGTYPGEKMAIYMPTAVFDFRNNLVYNFLYGTKVAQGAHVNVVNNYYRHGPTVTDDFEVHIGTLLFYPGSERPKVYCSGNIGPHRPNGQGDDWSLVRVGKTPGSDPEFRRDKEVLVPPVTTHPAAEVPERVLRSAGAHPRDDVDLRLVEEFRKGMGKAGYGYVEWKQKHGL